MRYTERKTSRYDREEAPVVDRCPICGCEIYDRYELDMFDGMCAECHKAIVDDEMEDEDD